MTIDAAIFIEDLKNSDQARLGVEFHRGFIEGLKAAWCLVNDVEPSERAKDLLEIYGKNL